MTRPIDARPSAFDAREMRWTVALFLLSVLGQTALAQPEEASRVFEQARTLADAGNWAEACPLFQHSYKLDPAPGTTLGMGECAERDSKIRDAWQLYKAAEEAFTRNGQPDRAQVAHDRAEALAPKLATVTIRIATPAVPGLTIQVGDHAIQPSAEIVDHVVRGELTVTAQAPGYTPFATKVAADQDVAIDIPALQTVNTLPVEPESPLPPPPRPSKAWRTVVLAGVGVTLVSVFLASQDGSQLAKYTGSVGLFGGVTASFVGLAMRRTQASQLRAARSVIPQPARVGVVPVIGPDRAAAALRVDW